MDQLHRAVLIKLLAEPIDVNLNEICFAVKMAIPDMLHDLTAGNKLRCPKQKQLEEGEFPGGEGNTFFVPIAAPAMPVEHWFCVPEFCVAAMEAPPNECPHTRKEFGQ